MEVIGCHCLLKRYNKATNKGVYNDFKQKTS